MQGVGGPFPVPGEGFQVRALCCVYTVGSKTGPTSYSCTLHASVRGCRVLLNLNGGLTNHMANVRKSRSAARHAREKYKIATSPYHMLRYPNRSHQARARLGGGMHGVQSDGRSGWALGFALAFDLALAPGTVGCEGADAAVTSVARALANSFSSGDCFGGGCNGTCFLGTCTACSLGIALAGAGAFLGGEGLLSFLGALWAGSGALASGSLLRFLPAISSSFWAFFF